MVFVGEYLKNSRLQKKIDLKTIAKELNITISLLTKIENDDFSDHLDSVYLIGHIRTYAKFLNLNDNEVIKQFKIQSTTNRKNFIEEMPRPLEKNNFNFYFFTKSFSLFSIVLISFCFYLLFIRSSDMLPNNSIIPDIPESLISQIEEFEVQSTLNNIGKINSEINKKGVILPTSTGTIFNNDSLVNESSVIASIPENDLVKLKNVITLKFIDKTWIQIRNEQQEIIISKLMSSNDLYSYSILDNFSLTAGNAGNILVSINGVTRGKVGKKGEIIDSLIINSDFNN